MKTKRSHWRHFFGGVALFLLIIQFFSGLVLTMFYLPHLTDAYASMQRIYNELSTVAWLRDTHRWAALFIVVSIIMHLVRSFLRKDYLNNQKSKTFWLTGVLVFLPLIGFLLTGFILPWEWRAYWFMEMVPNYAGEIAFIGPALKDFLVDAFTLNRSLVAHILIFPVITLVLLEIHTLSRIRKRKGGLSRYFIGHGILTIPFLLVIAVLAYALPMPTQDPEIIPMPLEGAYIPTVEWFILIFYVPYMHVKGFVAPLLGLYIPLLIFLVLAFFPYFLRKKEGADEATKEAASVERDSKFSKILKRIHRVPGLGPQTKVLAALGVFMVAMTLFGPLYAGTSVSPTMGCNSCHNVASGLRMGVPPITFKDRDKNPLLENSEWMVQHWFYPQIYW
ncbi:MAG: cytochrome b N-terminal domain-containing protein [Mariprofundaceae bacterium]